MYALLRSISAPRKPKELNFNEIVDTLAQHVDPKPIIIAERYKFHKAEQEKSETVRQCLAKLQKLAETCEFGPYREEAIRDRFVCGLRSQSIQRKLLAEAMLSLQTAVEKACASELTEKEASGFHGSSHDVKKVEGTLPECFRCGKTNHSPEKCFHRKAQCHGCQNFGHIVLKCPEKRPPKAKGGETKKSRKKKKRKPGGIHSIEETETVAEPVDKTAWPMFTVVDSQGRC